MTNAVPNAVPTALAGIADFVLRETGVVLSSGREKALRSAMQRAAPELDPDAFLRALSDPARDQDLVDRLIDEVTVQETTFARDRGQLDAIPWRSLLQQARAAGSDTVRAWSAGCATGEEPYTLALLAAEAFGPAGPPVSILGTDISGAALAAAVTGRYRERAVRALDDPLRRRYLSRLGDGTYLVAERLRSLVRFRRHNLADDPIPPLGEASFDLVICRNVLIYFTEPLARQVTKSLRRSLRPGGTLMLGAADALRRTPPRPGAVPAQPAGPRQARDRPLRRPLIPPPPRTREQRLAAALEAADKGHRGDALGQVESLLADDPLDADANFVQGLVTLEAGEPTRAAAALRRALYTDGTFALAAFTLGRAYDVLGDDGAARRAYAQALRTLDLADERHALLLQQVDLGDIAAACRTRLSGYP